jgi:hypothetical protein
MVRRARRFLPDIGALQVLRTWAGVPSRHSPTAVR